MDFRFEPYFTRMHLTLTCGGKDASTPETKRVQPFGQSAEGLYSVRMKGLEPPRPKTSDPKSDAAANYATCAGIVGVTGFEPATTWSQTRCATGLRYAPIVLRMQS